MTMPTPPKPPPPRRARSRQQPAPARSGGSSGGKFAEELHARDEGGKFTAGADANRGPGKDEPAAGQEGARVAGLQKLLAELGYGDLKADGKMGPQTVAALVRAQRNLGVAGEDGWLGPKTREAMRAERDLVTGPGRKKPRRARSRAAAQNSADWERRTRPSEDLPKPHASRPGAGSGGTRRSRARADGGFGPDEERAAREHARELGITDPEKIEDLLEIVRASRSK